MNLDIAGVKPLASVIDEQASCDRASWGRNEPVALLAENIRGSLRRRHVGSDSRPAPPGSHHPLEITYERTLWRLLYETARAADEVLRLNVEDLDIPAKRARTRSTGGDVDWLFLGSGSARLLSRLIAGRRAGPVFLSSLRPSPARAPAAAGAKQWKRQRPCDSSTRWPVIRAFEASSSKTLSAHSSGPGSSSNGEDRETLESYLPRRS